MRIRGFETEPLDFDTPVAGVLKVVEHDLIRMALLTMKYALGRPPRAEEVVELGAWITGLPDYPPENSASFDDVWTAGYNMGSIEKR